MKTNTLIIIIAIIILVAGSLLFVFLGKKAPNKQPNQKEQIQSYQEPPIESIATNAITIKNQAFIPNQITVGKGTTVVWTNEDNVNHSIKGKGFESPILKKGESYIFSFNEAGAFDYECGIHPEMKGKVEVEE